MILQIHGTCLGFQLLQILVSNVSRNDLLVETDSVSHATTMEWTGSEGKSRSFGNLSVSGTAAPVSVNYQSPTCCMRIVHASLGRDIFDVFKQSVAWYMPAKPRKQPPRACSFPR